MCRLVAYFGPPIRLSALLTEPPHGLAHQSFAPSTMTDGLLNADGWGVGWFASATDTTPGVIRGTQPIWSDINVEGAAHAITSGSIVGVVRAASPGIGVSPFNTPPYVVGGRLLAHNGRLQGCPGPLARSLRGRLDPEDEGAIRGTTDSELFGALWHTLHREAGGADATEALRAALRFVREAAAVHAGRVSANLLLADAHGLLAVRFAHPGPSPSLSLIAEGAHPSGGALVASEPLDDAPGWQTVAPSTLVRVDAQGIRCEPLFPEDR